MQNQPKGKSILKIVGILYIIYAAITILIGLVSLLGGGLLAIGSAGANGMLGTGLGLIAAFAGIVVLLSSILSLVTGILGVKWCARVEKANVLFVLGIVLVVFAVFNVISTISNHGSLWSSLFGLVLPVLYTLGAYWNKQEA